MGGFLVVNRIGELAEEPGCLEELGVSIKRDKEIWPKLIQECVGRR